MAVKMDPLGRRIMRFFRQLGYEDGTQVALHAGLLGCLVICALFINYCGAKPTTENDPASRARIRRESRHHGSQDGPGNFSLQDYPE